MQTIKKTLGVLLFLVFSVQAWASVPTVTFDNTRIYVRAPLSKALTQTKINEAALITADLMIQKVSQMVESGSMPMEITADNLKRIQSSSEQLADFILEVDSFNRSNQYTGSETADLIPTAFFAGFGAKFSAGMGLSGGGSVTIGVVVMPLIEYTVPRIPDEKIDLLAITQDQIEKLIERQVTSKVIYDWSIVAWPNLDIGVGAGATPGALRLSAGLIWGPMRSAGDFSGAVLGLSSGVSLVAGANVKGGMVHNSGLPSFLQLKYLIGGFDFGATAEVNFRFNASVLISGEKILGLFFNDQDLKGTIDPETMKSIRRQLGVEQVRP